MEARRRHQENSLKNKKQNKPKKISQAVDFTLVHPVSCQMHKTTKPEPLCSVITSKYLPYSVQLQKNNLHISQVHN